MDGGEEVLREAVVAGGDSAEILEASEHAFDGIAVAVEGRREAVFPAPVDLGRDVRRGAPALDLATDGIAVIALVATQDRGRRHLVEQYVGGDAIGHLAAGQEERDRTAERVRERVDFRRSPTPRPTDRLVGLPPFPPAALR